MGAPLLMCLLFLQSWLLIPHEQRSVPEKAEILLRE